MGDVEQLVWPLNEEDWGSLLILCTLVELGGAGVQLQQDQGYYRIFVHNVLSPFLLSLSLPFFVLEMCKPKNLDLGQARLRGLEKKPIGRKSSFFSKGDRQPFCPKYAPKTTLFPLSNVCK